jgi:hypothetical protein
VADKVDVPPTATCDGVALTLTLSDGAGVGKGVGSGCGVGGRGSEGGGSFVGSITSQRGHRDHITSRRRQRGGLRPAHDPVA